MRELRVDGSVEHDCTIEQALARETGSRWSVTGPGRSTESMVVEQETLDRALAHGFGHLPVADVARSGHMVRSQVVGAAEVLAGLSAAQRTFLRRLPAGNYLVGGAIRDSLLRRPVNDLDIVIRDDIERVIIRMRHCYDVQIERVTPRFGTARCHVAGVGQIDFSHARQERYEDAGALPRVRSGSMTDDLDRRDFTINAIAISTTGRGDVRDPHDGVVDCRSRRLRLLHPWSFFDDPTRMLRGVRYSALCRLRPDRDLSRYMTVALREGVLERVSARRLIHELQALWRQVSVLAGLDALVVSGLWRALFGDTTPGATRRQVLNRLGRRWPCDRSRWVAVLALGPALHDVEKRQDLLRRLDPGRSLRRMWSADLDLLPTLLMQPSGGFLPATERAAARWQARGGSKHRLRMLLLVAALEPRPRRRRELDRLRRQSS